MKIIKTKEASENSTVNLHEGHRERLRKRLSDKNYVEADEYQVLEYLLTLPIMRRDTNELAHKLINKFGSLANVLDSNVDDLITVDGISPTIAHFLHCIPYVFRNYKISKTKSKPVLTCPLDIFNYLGDAICHLPSEEFYMICLDNGYKVINKKILSLGGTTKVAIDIKQCVQYALSLNASKVIMLHNHPSSSADPSESDCETTKRMLIGFEMAGIDLFDHMIVNYEGKYFSFAISGNLNKYREQYKSIL